ncbi:guanine nucleotide binding protein 1 [Tieghemostelium lacteum]|uniref:Guanine nucleotide-binding protein-like 1 n=1 Tax=Tieghemostelium lacteum TaxID=361077 RepID=A0A151ZSK1_TIELA|nr:guanine nucleotide binding protein 1 [Tieghemostelium lacteum]|eukprot:KYQ96922.1 guanine nucleotide binding protein 1 [Tieghemostelium lacteum]
MGRSKPFSGKQKKDQLKAKKERKRVESEILELDNDISLHEKRQLARDILKSSDKSKKATSNSGTIRDKLSINSVESEELLDSNLFYSDSNHNSSASEEENDDEHPIDSSSGEDEESQDEDDIKVIKFNNQTIRSSSNNNDKNSKIRDIEKHLKNMDLKKKSQNQRGQRNKLVTIFETESREEVRERKLQSTNPLDIRLRSEPWLINQSFDNGSFIDIPKRLDWTWDMSSDKLKEQERKMFVQWLENISENYDKSRLNYFEHNLEVWRQLWRVSERSDVILLITDARYPLFHFPPALYSYIVNDLKKPMVLVLNKIDLVDRRIVDSWIDYFKSQYPHLSIISFSSFTAHQDSTDHNLDLTKKRKLKRGTKKYESSRGKQVLIKEILSLNIPKANNHEIQSDIQQFLQSNNIHLNQDDDNENEEDEDEDEDIEDDEDNEDEQDHKQDEEEAFKNDNMITIGMVGHPNVGKSSLINGLIGRKVVSTSRTPGHTKHFQTILLTRTIQLCDCPGLVFPALDRPKPLQILCGIFPIAQVREPYSAIRYLAERVPLEKVYGLQNPYPNEQWSPFSICEAFAKKRGYIIAKNGAEDTHRAGLEILKDCVDGNVVISWPPPNFTQQDYIQLGLVKLNSSGSEPLETHDDITNDDTSTSTITKSKKKKHVKTVNYGKPIGYEEYHRKKSMEEQQQNHHQDSSTTEEEDGGNNEEEMPLKVYKKNRPSHFSNNKQSKSNKSTVQTSTNSQSNNNQNNINQSAGKTKKLSAKALDYQEKLAEKQNKGGNKRQIL